LQLAEHARAFFLIATRAPSAAARSAIERPMPELPPVTRMVLSLSLMR
jgi:hypothetical protein